MDIAIETLIEYLPDHKLLLCTHCKPAVPSDDSGIHLRPLTEASKRLGETLSTKSSSMFLQQRRPRIYSLCRTVRHRCHSSYRHAKVIAVRIAPLTALCKRQSFADIAARLTIARSNQARSRSMRAICRYGSRGVSSKANGTRT